MNKHTATDPNGKIHTRNSKGRTYSHTVVANLDRAACEAQLLKSAEEKARTNYEFCCGRGQSNAYTNWRGEPETYRIHGKEYASGEEFMADYPTLQDDINYEVAQAQAVIDSRGQEFYDEYRNLGWNSRRDLAEKLASKETGRYNWINVTILEATIK